jgi:hypothetical protein
MAFNYDLVAAPVWSLSSKLMLMLPRRERRMPTGTLR